MLSYLNFNARGGGGARIAGTIDLQIGDQLSLTMYERGVMGRQFTAFMTGGILAIPVVGVFMDYFGFPATSFLTVLFACIWASLQVFPTKGAIVISFVFYSLFRTFLFTFLFAYLADTLGFKYFGVLAGGCERKGG